MEFIHTFMEKLNNFWQKVLPVLQKIGSALRSFGRGVSVVWSYIYKLRAIFLAVPVATVASVQSVTNMSRLPDMVEYNTLAIDKEAENALFGAVVMSVEQVSREIAVFGPLMLTVVCLLLLLCSKRTLYPWLISVFTLCVPLMIYLLNVYPM